MMLADGAPIETIGAELSTANVALGPAARARLPATSEAVPEAIEIPRVPLPEMPDSVTVRVVPLPETTMLLAVAPLPFKLMLPEERVALLKLASEYVTVKLTGPPDVMLAEGVPIAMVGAVLSIV